MRACDTGTSPRVLMTASFHLLEAWYEPGARTLPREWTTLPASTLEPRAYFRLLVDEPPTEDRLRRFPFVPPSRALLLFVPREAGEPWSWHRQSGCYLDIRARDRRRIFHNCDQHATACELDTEALWSAFWSHKEFSRRQGELSDIKIDRLAERVIDKARPEVDRHARTL